MADGTVYLASDVHRVLADRLSYLSAGRFARLERAVSDVATIPGDFVEFGVALGGSGVGQMVGALAGPPQRRGGIPSCTRINQRVQRLQERRIGLGQLFPPAARLPLTLGLPWGLHDFLFGFRERSAGYARGFRHNGMTTFPQRKRFCSSPEAFGLFVQVGQHECIALLDLRYPFCPLCEIHGTNMADSCALRQ